MNRPRYNGQPAKVQSQIEQFFSVSKIQAPKEQSKYKSIKVSSYQIIQSQSAPNSIVQSVTCPICSMILPMPHYQCTSCNNLFCPNCLSDWWLKNPNTCIFKCNQSSFKLIKRSNTYNAVLELIKVKCQLCQKVQSVAELQNHLNKYCPDMWVECVNDDCSQLLKRRDIEEHQKQCKFRLAECEYCKKKMQFLDMQEHQNFKCTERKIVCKNQQCGQEIVFFKVKQHQKICLFKRTACQWCHKDIYQKDQKEHQNSCELKRLQCHWCRIQLFLPELIKHDCPQKLQVCPLCEQKVKCQIFKQHKLECMFENMVKIKHQSQALLDQNEKLTRKVVMLEEALQQSAQKHTMKILNDVKKREMKQLKLDLQRVQYSLKSVEKLKKQQVQSHMLFPHLIQSWCPVCKMLDKKFSTMLDPLITKRKQIYARISEMTRYQSTIKGQ